MSFEWRPFTDLLSVIVDNRGRTCPVGEVGLPLIATNCIDPSNLYPSYQTTRFVSEETYRSWFRGHPRPGDILFVCKGSPGRTNWCPDPVDFCIAQDMVAVRADQKKVAPKYLFAALRSSLVQSQIDTLHVGTMIPHFKKGDFGKLRIPVPALGAQIEIGDFYFEVSCRIALLRETNATLEAIAKALFKSWFVDFDPIRAKQQRLAPAGMDEATAALFPDGFEESTLGSVPRGWRTGSILEVADLLSGGTPKTDRSEFWGGDIAWASAKDVSQAAGSILVSTERTITTAGLERSATRLIPRLATVVVARGATTGRMVMFGREMAMNQTCYGLTSKLDTPVALYCLLRREIEALVNAAHGSVFDTITTSTFARSIVVQPPTSILARFEEIGRPLFERIAESTARIQTLATLRDALLPRLISGQLRLPEAEAQISEATI